MDLRVVVAGARGVPCRALAVSCICCCCICCLARAVSCICICRARAVSCCARVVSVWASAYEAAPTEIAVSKTATCRMRANLIGSSRFPVNSDCRVRAACNNLLLQEMLLLCNIEAPTDADRLFI